jgi:hypothetical protein
LFEIDVRLALAITQSSLSHYRPGGFTAAIAALKEDEMSKIRAQYHVKFLTVFAAFAMAACSEQVPTDLDVAATTSPSVIESQIDLGPCDSLAVPPGHTLAARLYAQGVQIYRWNGSSWVFDAPDAVLTADADGNGVVGTHFRGPTWQSSSGSAVVGAVAKRCVPDPNSIPWLLLNARSSNGPGIFDGVTYIQRINTVGGNAPALAGSVVGEEARVPYTTIYLFYRAE